MTVPALSLPFHAQLLQCWLAHRPSLICSRLQHSKFPPSGNQPLLATLRRCLIRITELAALLTASQGMGAAMQESEARRVRHGNAYTFRQFTRLNFSADHVSTAQVAQMAHVCLPVGGVCVTEGL